MNSWPARKSLTGLDKMLATIFNMEPERGSWGGSTPTFHIPDAIQYAYIYACGELYTVQCTGML